MKGSSKPKTRDLASTRQKPLTSFFFTKNKEQASTPSQAGAAAHSKPAHSGAKDRLREARRKVPEDDASCEIIAIDDSPNSSPAKASPFFSAARDQEERPAKRAKIVPASEGVQTWQADAEVPEGTTSEAVHIPSRVAARHQSFQTKLASAPRRNSPEGGTHKHTPLELQVVELKKQHPGVILVFEVGYKFRFFGEDAEIAAAVCNIFCYPDRNFMTASIPVPRLHVYVRRLVAAGHKVGIVRQTETAALKAAGSNRNAPFTRKLTALYTRSTLEAGDKGDIGEGGATEMSSGADARSSESLSSYLVCLVEEADPTAAGQVGIGIVAVETSTGDVLYSQFRDGMMRAGLEAHLMFATPSELLVARPLSTQTERLLGSFSQAVRGLKAEEAAGGSLSSEAAAAAVASFYTSGSLSGKSPDLEALPPLVLQALAHALRYLQQFGLQAVLRQACAFRQFSEANEIALSPNALRQLEVLRNSFDGSERCSLLWLLDQTKTAMGGRLMRSWVTHPLRNPAVINERLDAVGELASGEGDDGSLVSRLRSCLASLPDLERGVTRILHRTASPSELLQTLSAFSALPRDLGVKVDANGAAVGLEASQLQRLFIAASSPEAGDAAAKMLDLIHAAAAEANNKLDLFRSRERFPLVFQRREELRGCEDGLAGLLPYLAKRLRIPHLEFKSVQNQGDFLVEVDVHRADIPKDWEKISSTKKVSRFRPPEVTEAVRQLEMAKERLQAAADEAYMEYLGSFASLYMPFRSAASALAALDALQSLALVSGNSGYVRPVFADAAEPAQLHIVQGRHPVLDATMESPYVPNDTHLAGGGAVAQLITGPNMGGKSSYIRQVALIAIMAQIGSWVPATAVKLRAIDAVHTRMGASDNLAQGRSTFLEELSETSSILAAATESSLVVIDELGRGTSTHDGLAIAYATMHFLVQRSIPLLFVTHYPKVAALQKELPGLVEARFMSYLQEIPAALGSPATRAIEQVSTGRSVPSAKTPRITFLYKLVPGVADRSFGLNVARMASLPGSVVERAAKKAQRMEEQSLERTHHTVQESALGLYLDEAQKAILTCDAAGLLVMKRKLLKVLSCGS